MKKKVIFIAIVVLLAIGVIVAVVARNQFSHPPRSTSSPSPQTQTADEARKNALMRIKGYQGKPWILDKNNTQQYVLADENDYSIDYFGKYDYFLIQIKKLPFTEKRREAEQRFLQIVNTSPTVACKLNVALNVPFDVSHDLAGKNFPLSFCQ